MEKVNNAVEAGRTMRAEGPGRASVFVVATQGTWGDINPFIFIIRALRQAHSNCVIVALANENWEDTLSKEGVAFRPICKANIPQDKLQTELRLERIIYPSFVNSYQAVLDVADAQPIDAVIGLDNCRGVEAACEKRGLRYLKVCLAPYAVPSQVEPPYPFALLKRLPLSLIVRGRRMTEWVTKRVKRRLTETINDFRTSVGLAAIDDILSLELCEEETVALFPEWFARRQPDWPSNFRFIGFPITPDTGDLPRDLASFLAAGESPIVVFPGSGLEDCSMYYAIAMKLHDDLDARVVFINPRDGRFAGDERFFIQEGLCNLELLLRHASCLFHHGGMGTTSSAFRAGIPQFVFPRIYDQLDNGMRVKQLGVGDIFVSHFWSYRGVLKSYRRIMESDAVKTRLAAIMSTIWREDDELRSLKVRIT